jgi:hypothetical protein
MVIIQGDWREVGPNRKMVVHRDLPAEQGAEIIRKTHKIL